MELLNRSARFRGVVKKLALLGFAFKANTNDTRESPAIRIAMDLLEEGAQLAIHDPKVDPNQIARDLAQLPSDFSIREKGEGIWHFCLRF